MYGADGKCGKGVGDNGQDGERMDGAEEGGGDEEAVQGRQCQPVEVLPEVVGNGHTVVQERCVEIAATDATKQPNARYTMPARYAKCIEDIVRGDAKVKPRLVRGMMVNTLGIHDGGEPDDFSTQQEIDRKVGTVKDKLKREKQAGKS